MRKTGERFNPYRLFYGVFIPEALVRLPVNVLSQGAKVTYGRLVQHGGAHGEVYPQRTTLASEVGCGVRQVDSYLKELRVFPLIEVERLGLGRANRYFFLWHEIFEKESNDARLKLRNSSTQEDELSKSKMQDGSTLSIEKNHVKRLIENERGVLTDYYRAKIDQNARLTPKARKTLGRVLGIFTLSELKEAVDGFSSDSWCMENQRHQGIAWFFCDEDRIASYISKAKRPSTTRTITIS